jgi:glutamate dehydrogenase (NADP+)
MSQSIETFIAEVTKKNPNERILQAVLEVAETVIPFIEENKNTKTKCFWERMVESDRIIMFRVAWIDDKDKHK